MPNTGSIQVRLANPRDLGFVAGDGDLPIDVVAQLVEQRRVYLASLDGEPAGYARIEYLWSKFPFISLVRVVERHRRRGLGRALLAAIESDAKRAGQTHLYSSSQADEPEPQAWHRHMGFVECGYIAGINPGDVGEIFFRKPLADAN
jgi:predicted GNAT superfamily acetyltransferase